ncbi:VWA domain-containing protein [bacterium]|nr:VWA domain-containing protein [bacterium]
MKKIKYIIVTLAFFIFINNSISAYTAVDGRYNYSNINSPGINTMNIQHTSNEEILFIVDFSGSMNKKMGYTPKIYLAIDAIEDLVRSAPDDKKIGLRIFGVTDKEVVRQTPTGIVFNKQNICSASTLMLPIAKYNAGNISEKLSRINPSGGSPIGYSLRQAVQNDFSNGNHIKHIILVTDGGENCGDSPCAYIRSLMNIRHDIKIDVIAITVDNNDYADLDCLAKSTNGNYYNVDSPEDFKIKFQQAFNSVPKIVPPTTNIKVKTVINNNCSYCSGTKYKTYGFQFEN